MFKQKNFDSKIVLVHAGKLMGYLTDNLLTLVAKKHGLMTQDKTQNIATEVSLKCFGKEEACYIRPLFLQQRFVHHIAPI